jgi:hypothetical protein
MNHGTHKHLSEVEAERAATEEAAAAWAAQHQLGNLPGQRSETGESSGRQSVAPGRLRQDDGLARQHRDPTSIDSYPGGAAQYEEDHPEARFLVVTASLGALDYDEVEKRARMNHVYSFLRDEQVDVLRKWGIEGMTLEAIALEEGVSKQAVHKRLGKAKAAFVAAYEAHWDDDTLTEEP